MDEWSLNFYLAPDFLEYLDNLLGYLLKRVETHWKNSNENKEAFTKIDVVLRNAQNALDFIGVYLSVKKHSLKCWFLWL